MPAEWSRILERCFEQDPERRPASAAELVKLLEDAVQSRHRSRRRTWAAVILIAAAILGVLALARRSWIARNPALYQLFTESGEYVWSVSPDSRSIAETLWDTGDLAIRDTANGHVRRLTHAPKSPGYHVAWGAVFSPDSRQLAYRWSNSRTDSELRIIGADGKGERVLHKDANQGFHTPLDWSPDGKRILAQGSLYSLAAISAVDGSVSPVNGAKIARPGGAMFTPDGTGIVFDVLQPGSQGLFDIRRMSMSGVETKLVEHPANDSLIGWSPDGRKLIFSSDRSGRPGIWALNVSEHGVEGEPQELRPGAGEIEPLGISRDGSLYYRLDAQRVNVFTAVLDLVAGRTVSEPKPIITRFTGPYEYPNWSEDGSRLVFDSRLSPELLIHTLEGGTMRTLPVNITRVWRPQWYAHGTAIVAIGMANGWQGHFRIDPATGAINRLISFDDVGGNYEGVWSSDGATMFNRYNDWKRGLFRLNVKTGERKILYVPPTGVDLGTENLALSPDEQTLAFHARDDAAQTASLMLVPANGGEARALLTIKQPEAFRYGSFAWAPDSKQILASRTQNDASEIWRVPVDGSPPAKIEFPAMRVLSLRLNHDGKTIAFTNVKDRAEIWVIERFLK